MVGHIVLLTTWLLTLAFLSAFRFEIALQTGVIAWFTGWVIWTLAEYFLNRYLLHLPGSKNQFLNSIIQFHMHHHNDPDDIQFIFVHPLLIGICILPVMVGSVTAAGGAGLLVTSGFLFGYLWFILAHAMEHHYTAPRIGLLKSLWQNHYLHHKSSEHRAFGVSTSLWDLLFRSLPSKHTFITVDPVNMKAARSYRIVEVNDKLTEKIFLELPGSIYVEDKNWIPQIQSEIQNIFNPIVNPYFTHGAAKRWILVDQSGAVWGRIAAFVNFQKILQDDQWIGGIGFFECKSDKSAAFLLFDAAVDWLVEYFKVTAVEGPINFGENDKYWGLLINGFTRPSYGMNYNHPFYRKFFEAYGFNIQCTQLTNYFDLTKPIPERFMRISERIINNKRYQFSPFSYVDADRFVRDFLSVYNRAWASFKNFEPITEPVVRKSLREMKPIMEEDFVWFAYANHEPVGFLLALPDANEILKYCGNVSNLWGKLKFFFYKYRIGFSRLRVVVMGIVPEFQNHGLESGLIMEAYKRVVKKPHYKHVELSWVGDFNDKMLAIHKAMGAVADKQHATFRKVL